MDENLFVEKLLASYRGQLANEELKKEIYAKLVDAQVRGLLQKPFQVVLRKDPSAKHRPQIEVILETKS